jgi:predicted nucleic acid-binding protein
LDTNILLRWALPQDPQHALVVAAIETLKARRSQIHVCPQNIVEFWNVATRPVERNGFGYAPSATGREIRSVLAFFRLAEETPAIFPEWLRLVEDHGVSGVKVHDARLAAVMRVHRLTHLLTFNGDDFKRYTDITIVAPQDLAATG